MVMASLGLGNPFCRTRKPQLWPEPPAPEIPESRAVIHADASLTSPHPPGWRLGAWGAQIGPRAGDQATTPIPGGEWHDPAVPPGSPAPFGPPAVPAPWLDPSFFSEWNW